MLCYYDWSLKLKHWFLKSWKGFKVVYKNLDIMYQVVVKTTICALVGLAAETSYFCPNITNIIFIIFYFDAFLYIFYHDIFLSCFLIQNLPLKVIL